MIKDKKVILLVRGKDSRNETIINLNIDLVVGGNQVIAPDDLSLPLLSIEEAILFESTHRDKCVLADEVYIVNEANRGKLSKEDLEYVESIINLNKKVVYYKPIKTLSLLGEKRDKLLGCTDSKDVKSLKVVGETKEEYYVKLKGKAKEILLPKLLF